MAERYMVVLDKGQLQELEKLCELRRQALQQDWGKQELGQLKTIGQAFSRKAKIHD